MNMKLPVACVAALVAAGTYAEEAAAADATDDVAAAEAAVKEQQKDDTRWFFTLPLCRRVDGGGEVRKIGESEWQPVEEGRFYPLGSAFRASAANSTVVIAFGKECSVTVENGAAFASCVQKLGEKSRKIVLTGGEVQVSLPNNMKDGLFSVETPGFSVCNMAGESRFVYADTGDGLEADIRCVTGQLKVEGRHFEVPAMHAADMMRVRCSHDNLETILYGKSGDYIVNLDRGQMVMSEVQDDGTVKDTVDSSKLEWHLSVSTRVQINRAVPAVGKRMSVTMMTFDSSGTMKNHFAFAESRPEVNTGELVVKAGGSEEVAKRAAEVTTEAAAAETEDEPAAAEEENKDEKKEESSDSSDEL